MTDLQDIAIAAHGDIERWRSYDRLTARVVNGGALWDLKGQGDLLDHYTASIELHRQFAGHTPFGGEGLRSHFTPERVAVETTDGVVVQERVNPREAFAGHVLDTPWDRLHAAYFTGYAMWNYLTEPFSFAEPGFAFAELEPWQEGGETWRRLQVTFPERLVTHTRVQTYYIDDRGLIRRHDYHPDVLGPSDRDSAHYSWDHKEFDGFVFPTKRSVHLTDENGRKVPEPVVVSIELDDIALS
jgi:hypothetical protein